MNLDSVKKGLLNEAKAEERKIIKQAEKDAESLIASANDKAKQTVADAKKRAQSLVEAERNERISAAKLRAKKMLSDASNKVVEDALSQLRQEFMEIRKSPSYEKIMKRLISEAEKEFEGKCEVFVNEDDIKTAKKISKNVSAKAVNISGGAIIASKDGKISIDNSLESIFEGRQDDLKRILFAEISSGENK